MTSVAIIEDQQVLCGAIEASLGSVPDLSLVGSAATVDEGLELASRTTPDVLVCDVRLADGDVTGHIPRLLEASPTTKILVFTGWPDESSFLDAMSAGASGFIDKGCPFGDFLGAIRRVACGETVVAPRFIPALTRRATDRSADTLSRRELEVLQLLADGCATGEIAEQLILSVNTVRNHVARLMNKLGAHSRLEAVNVGVRQGLIRYDPPR